MVVIGIPCALLPCEMTGDYRPQGPDECRVGIKLEMPQQLIDEHEVHVIVMKLAVVVRTATDISVAIHRRAPFVGSSGKVVFLIHEMALGHRHSRDLTSGVCLEMALLAKRPSQEVAHVGGAPARQLRPPAHSAVQPCLAVPRAVGRHHDRTAKGVEIRVGGVETDHRGQLASTVFGPLIAHGEIMRAGGGEHRGVEREKYRPAVGDGKRHRPPA